MQTNSLIPSPGQSVYLRSQFFRVNSISTLSSNPHKTPQHLVSLSQMNENTHSIQIIWELEINPISNYSIQTPLPHNKHSQNYDTYPLLQSILLAHQCSDSIKIHQRCLLSPLKNSLNTHPFQFVPAYRTLNNPRINLFLADPVGLGKSIEAGLLISELLAKQRAQRILILCPSNLQKQWRNLLLKHFSLNFQIVNRQFIQQFHNTHGLTSNPWKNSCFAISSLDFLKQFNQTQLFLQSLKNHKEPIRPWDLLIIDEAHRITPKNHSSLRQSERTKLAKTLLPLFEHRLFISATPHDGSTQNFKALLQLLDPLKFSTKKNIDPQILQTTLIRRPKSLIQTLSPKLKLPKRIVKFIPFQFSTLERTLQKTLDSYIQLALQQSNKQSMKLVSIILKKRLLSSIQAFSISFKKHSLLNRNTPQPNNATNNTEQQLFDPSWLTLEQEHLENKLFCNTSRLFQHPKLKELAEDILRQLKNPKLLDSKSQTLVQWTKKSKNKVIIFSEYIDSLKQLSHKLPQKQFLTLTSQLSRSEQSAALKQFQSKNSPKILLATDVAAEGLNLQFAAHNVIHLDIPWNPSRLEQRNGRVDRYAQPNDTVHCLHFLATNSNDHLILKKALNKIKNVRDDLGANNQVIALEIETALLNNQKTPQKHSYNTLPDSHISLREHTLEINKISKLIHNTQNKFQLSNHNQRRLINSALELLNYPPLQPSKRGWTILQVPKQWRHPNPDLDTKPHSIIFQKHKKLHLNHPLLKHALHLLTNQQPDAALHKTPTRIAFLPTNEPYHSIRLFQRVAWFNSLGAKIHEFNAQFTGRILANKIQWTSQKQNPIPKIPRKNPITPNSSTLQFIEQHSKQHAHEINKLLTTFKARELSRAKRALRKIRQKRLLHERQTCLLKLRELQQRQQQLQQPQQLLLWPIDLLSIISKESDSLTLRESQLQNQLNNIPNQITQQLTLHQKHGLQITPVATLYFFPNSKENER